MRVRDYAEFEADFRLDWAVNEDGYLVHGHGLPAAQELAKVLLSIGGVQDRDVEVEHGHDCAFRCVFDDIDITVTSNYDGQSYRELLMQ